MIRFVIALLIGICTQIVHSQTWNKLIENPFNFGGAEAYGVRIIDDTVYVSSMFVITDSITNTRGVLSKHSLGSGDLIEAVPYWDSSVPSTTFNSYSAGFNQLYPTIDNKIYLCYTPFFYQELVTGETELLIINKDLSVESQYVLDGFVNDTIRQIEGTRIDIDGNILCYGSRASTPYFYDPDSSNTWLTKVSPDGEQFWTRNYEDSYSINSLYPMSNGDIVFNAGQAGFTISTKYLIKANSEGEEMWRLRYGGGFTGEQAFPIEDENGNIVVANNWNISEGLSGNQNLWYRKKIQIQRISDLGNDYEFLEDKKYALADPTLSVHGIDMLASGDYVVWGDIGTGAGANYIVEGDFAYFDRPYVRGFILKLNADLDSLWMRTYYVEDDDPYQFYSDYYISDVAEVETGGFVTAGWGSIHDLQNLEQVWVMRLDEYGCLEPGCQNVNVSEVVIGLENTMTVYPNPVVDFCTIEFNISNPESHQMDFNDTELVLLDIQGKEAQRISIPNFGNSYKVTLDVQSLPAGAYQAHWVKNNSWLDSVQIVK